MPYLLMLPSAAEDSNLRPIKFRASKFRIKAPHTFHTPQTLCCSLLPVLGDFGPDWRSRLSCLASGPARGRVDREVFSRAHRAMSLADRTASTIQPVFGKGPDGVREERDRLVPHNDSQASAECGGQLPLQLGLERGTRPACRNGSTCAYANANRPGLAAAAKATPVLEAPPAPAHASTAARRELCHATGQSDYGRCSEAPSSHIRLTHQWRLNARPAMGPPASQGGRYGSTSPDTPAAWT